MHEPRPFVFQLHHPASRIFFPIIFFVPLLFVSHDPIINSYINIVTFYCAKQKSGFQVPSSGQFKVLIVMQMKFFFFFFFE